MNTTTLTLFPPCRRRPCFIGEKKRGSRSSSVVDRHTTQRCSPPAGDDEHRYRHKYLSKVEEEEFKFFTPPFTHSKTLCFGPPLIEGTNEHSCSPCGCCSLSLSLSPSAAVTLYCSCICKKLFTPGLKYNQDNDFYIVQILYIHILTNSHCHLKYRCISIN